MSIQCSFPMQMCDVRCKCYFLTRHEPTAGLCECAWYTERSVCVCVRVCVCARALLCVSIYIYLLIYQRVTH